MGIPLDKGKQSFVRLQTRTPPEISEQWHLARQRITDEQRITVESEKHSQTHLERHRITNEQSRITVRKEHRQTCLEIQRITNE